MKARKSMMLKMRIRLLFMLAAISMALDSAHGGIGDWKNFTAMNSIRALASSHDSVWAATSGGAFLYRTTDSSFTRFTNSEGLTTNDLTAITIDKAGSIWFGQSNGSIDVYTPATGRWRPIRDIAVASVTQKSITCFYNVGDSMYIGSSFGVSLFSISRFKFIDTYINFGRSVIPPVLSVVSFLDRVYVATATGIVVSDTAAVNLASPASWDPFPVGAVSTLALMNGKIFAGGDGGLLTFDGGSWLPVAAASQPVVLTGQSNDTLFFTCENTVFAYSMNGSVRQIGTQISRNVTCGTPVAGVPVIGTDLLGLAQWNAASVDWIYTAPNGPASNGFVSIAVDNDGVIWCGSGREHGHGFYSYNGSIWTNYSKANIPGMKRDEAFGVAIGPNNSKWISTWGGGLILMNSAGEFVRIFDDQSPGFVGTPTPDYTVPVTIATGRDGSVWTSIYGSADLSKTVWKMNSDFTWEAFPAPLGTYNQMLGVAIDRNNTKWFVNQLPAYPAATKIVYLNENLAVAGTSDGWGMLTVADGATSEVIYSVVEDRDGQLWLGTGSGITIIPDPSHPSKSIGRVFLGAIFGQQINCITVDALNNKWVGTPRGVFVLSPDGTTLVDQYSVMNSNGKLVDDDVYSIAFDTKKGVAYFATGKGLSSVGIKTVAPAMDFAGISVAPNPFRPGDQAYVMIQGLAEGSTIKILTIHNTLVKQFTAQGGGRAFWDGKTETGAMVASGIYLAVAYNANGSQIGIAKMAVIHR
jgi:hypothetical protein